MTDADATYRRVAWRLIPLLILCYFSAYIDRSNIGIAKLAFSRDLDISEAMFGLAGGLFYLGYCLFEIPSNALLRRVGARQTFFRILVLWSSFTALLALVSEAWHFYLLRFLIGAAEAGFFPGVLYYLSHWAPAARRARFTALFMSAMAVSGVIGGPLSGFILRTMDGLQGLHGWQWLFIVEGLPGILLGLLVLAALPERPRDASWLTLEQKSSIEADLAAESRTAPGNDHASLTTVLRQPRFWALAAMSAALIGGIGGIALWMPTILRQAGLGDAATVATLTALPYACALIAQQWQARRSDRYGERRWHAALPIMIAAVLWGCVPMLRAEPMLVLLLMCSVTAACFAATGPFWALPPTMLRGHAAALGIAAVTTAGGLSAFVSPIVVGWAADRWDATSASCFYYSALLLFGAIVLLLGTKR
jgi:sugar phosphate permease